MQQGDEAAFAELYDLYAETLIDFAALRLNSLNEAQDIVQDLFVLLWQERQSISITTSVKSYLYAAIRYRIINYIRKNNRHKKYVDKIAKLPTVTITSEDEVYVKELQSALQEAVDELSPRVKQVFQLSRFEHLTVPEIAERLQTSEQTVKNQLSTALSQLRSKLTNISFVLWWL